MAFEQTQTRKAKDIRYVFPAQNQLGEEPCASGWLNAAKAARW